VASIPPPPPPPEPSERLRELVRSGRFADALAAFRAGDGPGWRRPDLLLLAATAATRIGELAEARSLAAEALAGFRARGDLDGRMRALNLLGVIGFEQGRVPEAESAFREALGLAQELADTQLAARAANNLASLEHLRGRAAEALSLYRGALLAYQRLGDRRGAAETYHNLGLVFREMENWREAEDAAGEAVRHAEVVGEPSLLAIAVTGRAEIRLQRGELALAEPELDRAARFARDSGDELGVAEVRRLRARAAIGRGDDVTALQEAEAAYGVAIAQQAALLAADCAAVLALALRRLGREADAASRRSEALDAYHGLGAEHLAARFEAEWAAGA